MAVNPISSPLPADLPTNWETGQTVAPNGSDVGLAEQYGYNYQSQQINAAQQAINTIGTAFENLYGNADTVPVSNGGTGSTTPQTALVNLGAASNPNLLDNWYFVGGGTYGNFPINQRGVSGTISSPGYFIDRWNLTAGSVEITSAGLVLNGTISQILETAPNVSNFTATALTSTGIIEAQYDSESKTFSITGTGQTFIAAKLEIGEIQTIAYQNSESEWALNSPPPNYQQELSKCQRYFYRLASDSSSTYLFIGQGNSGGGTEAITFPFDFPVRMRITPTMSPSGSDCCTVTQTTVGSGQKSSAITMLADDSFHKKTSLQVAAGNVTANTLFRVWLNPNGYINFSADL